MRANGPVSTAQPASGWRLMVRRTFSAAGMRWPVGCEFPADVLAQCRNHQALFDNNYLRWCPPGPPATAKPVALAAPTPEPPRPQVEIVRGDGVIATWRATKARMVKLCLGDAARAMDFLLAHHETASLYRVAVAEACQQEAKRLKRVSISPDQLEHPL